MGSENTHIDFEQVVKYLSNEAGETERLRVEGWIAGSESNKVEFEKIRSLWIKTGGYRQADPVQVDPLQAWEKLRNRLDGGKIVPFDQTISHRKGAAFYLVRAAAVIIFLITAVYILQLGRNQNKIVLQAENVIIRDTLPDQSVVALNAGSKVIFTVRPEARLAALTGEAFFEVKPGADKPFIVNAKNALVKVVGTSFNLQAYPEKDSIILSMATGAAWFLVTGGTDSLLVSAGSKAFYSRSSGKMGFLEAEAANDAFWLTKTLIFKRTDLSQVFDLLEKNYQVDISVANPGILNCRLSARYKDATIENILDQIAAVFNLQVSGDGNEFQIAGEGCN